MFAHTLTDVVAHYFEILSQPNPFHLVELGSGEGVLGRDIKGCLKKYYPHVFEQTKYVPIEVNSGELPDQIQGVVFSNEFFDALPVHRVRVRGEELYEIYIQIDDQIFVAARPTITKILGEVSSPGFYKFIPGKRVNDYINLAGGFSQNSERKD